MKTLRIAFDKIYPFVNPRCSRFPTYRPSKLCSRPGFMVEIYYMIAQHINVTIEPIDATCIPFHEKVEGLYNGSYDLFGYPVESTKGRLDDFDFSEPLYESTTKFAVKRSDSQIKSIFNFFTVYGVDVYFLLFAAFFVFTVFGVLVRLTEFRLFLREQIGIGEFLWQMLRLQLIQSENLAYKLKAGNISLITFAFFQCVLVISLYQSWVLTSLVRSRSILPFKIQDLLTVIKNKQFYFVAAREKEWYYEMINKSFESPFYELRGAMVENPTRIVHKNSRVLEELNGGRAIAVIQDDTEISFLVTKECNLVYLDTIFPPTFERIMIRKNHPLLKAMNESIRALRLDIYKTFLKYQRYRPPSMCQNHSHGPEKLTMAPYIGVLILYFVGIGTGILVFGSERLLSSIKKRSFVFVV